MRSDATRPSRRNGETPEAAVQAEDALGRLLNLDLLEPNVAGAVRLHRLLAVFVRAVALDAAAQTAVKDVLLAAVRRLYDAGYPGPLLVLHPYLRAVTEAAQSREDARTARLGMALGAASSLLGDYAGAQPAGARALALRERGLGADHPDTVASLYNLAKLYQAQRDYESAELLYQRALATMERVLGPEHPAVAASLNNLSELYYAQGRYAEAEPLLQRTLAFLEQVLGLDHPDVKVVRQNYLTLLRATNHHAEADTLEARVRTGQTPPRRAESS